MDARVAGTDDAGEVARLLHDFNTEFETPSPGVDVLTRRLRTLLGTDHTMAILSADPPAAVALITLRSNVWFDGLVALLDEMYVAPHFRGQGIGTSVLHAAIAAARFAGAEAMEINVDEGDVDAQRFYVRHGFSSTDPDTGEPALYFYSEL